MPRTSAGAIRSCRWDLFVLRSTVLDEPGTFEKALDMLRKLRAESDVYDATCVVLAEWDEGDFAEVSIRNDAVPGDLRADRFLATLIDNVLARTPIEMHVAVRELREHRNLLLEESDTGEVRPSSLDEHPRRDRRLNSDAPDTDGSP